MTMFDLSGRVAVVTGGNGGIGLGMARGLAAAGTRVVVAARNAEKAAAAVAELGTQSTFIALDVADESSCRAAIDQTEKRFGRVDILVNNAGVNQPQPFLEVDEPTLDLLLGLNVRAAFVVAQAAARLMVANGGGVIVNVSSQMGHVGSDLNRTVYVMTKHAVEGLTKAMAVELAPKGVRVVSIAPTFVTTPLTKPFFEDPAFRKWVLDRIPLGRLGTVEEVASAVVFLASPAAALVTGSSLLVDGGWTAW